MEYEYNCSYFQYNNITPPNVAQQMQGITLVDRNVINLSPRDINSSISMISNLYFFPFSKALGKLAFGVGIAGTISTILLTILFIINVFTNIKRSPARRRRLLCWITSMPMVVSVLSLIIFLVPRASDVCDIVKQMYVQRQ